MKKTPKKTNLIIYGYIPSPNYHNRVKITYKNSNFHSCMKFDETGCLFTGHIFFPSTLVVNVKKNIFIHFLVCSEEVLFIF